MTPGSWPNAKKEPGVASCEKLEKDSRSEGRHRGAGVRGKTTSIGESRFSCRSRDQRWRTKLDFTSGESFDDHHRPTTLGTRPKIARTGGGGLLLGLRCPVEQLEGKWQGGGPFAVRQEAEVADAHEIPGAGATGGGARTHREIGHQFCSLLCAESRQRNVTFPSANETRRWLEIATR